jgi:hypothetical protein
MWYVPPLPWHVGLSMGNEGVVEGGGGERRI